MCWVSSRKMSDLFGKLHNDRKTEKRQSREKEPRRVQEVRSEFLKNWLKDLWTWKLPVTDCSIEKAVIEIITLEAKE